MATRHSYLTPTSDPSIQWNSTGVERVSRYCNSGTMTYRRGSFRYFNGTLDP